MRRKSARNHNSGKSKRSVMKNDWHRRGISDCHRKGNSGDRWYDERILCLYRIARRRCGICWDPRKRSRGLRGRHPISASCRPRNSKELVFKTEESSCSRGPNHPLACSRRSSRCRACLMEACSCSHRQVHHSAWHQCSDSKIRRRGTMSPRTRSLRQRPK